MREAIKKKQKQIDLENAEGLQEEIDKMKRELISLETEHQKVSEKHIQKFAEQQAERDIQLIADSEAADFEEENASEALKTIRKWKEALDWQIRKRTAGMGKETFEPSGASW